MTDVPVSPQARFWSYTAKTLGIDAAIQANDANALADSRTWLGEQEIRSWLDKLGFNDAPERRLVIEAWEDIGWAARLARHEQPDSPLGRITFGTHSPKGVSGLAPTISLADFSMVISDEGLLDEARRLRGSENLQPEAIDACDIFVGRLSAHLHS